MQPRWELILFVGLLLRTLRRLFSHIESAVESVVGEMFDIVSDSSAPLNLGGGHRNIDKKFEKYLLRLVFTLSIMLLSISLVGAFALRLAPFPILPTALSASCIFLITLDADLILAVIQVRVVLCLLFQYYLRRETTAHGSCTVSGLQSTSHTPEAITNPQLTSRKLKAVLEIMHGTIIRALLLGAGATSGHQYLETISRLALLQLTTYVGLSLTLVPPMLTMFRLSCPEVKAAKQKERSVLTIPHVIRPHLIRRIRSRSCSVHQSAYPERRPVDPRTLMQQLTSTHAISHAQRRIKYLTALSLVFLFLHNRYITQKNRSDSETSYQRASASGSKTAIRPIVILFDYTDLNMLCFLLVGVLLYWRTRIHESTRAELLNLDLQSSDVQQTLEPVFLNGAAPGQRPKTKTCPVTDCVTLPKITEVIGASSALSSHVAKQKNELCSTDPSLFLKRSKSVYDHETSNEELLHLLSTGQLKTRELESVVGDYTRAVELRRADLFRALPKPHALERLPFRNYDYRLVYGQCCEEVIGFVPIPVGKVGPLLVDGRSHYLPLATTEGCLVASTNRGCRALFLAGGVKSVVFRDQMTRAPVVRFPSIGQVVECIAWIESPEGFQVLKDAFDRTSSHINLLSVFPNPSGQYLHIRFAARTGDAMGMNMVSKATNSALQELYHHFPSMQVISLSGNMCTDKKAATVNTILGRGKSVIAEATVPATVLAQVLHTTAERLTRLAHAKNWTGSAMAGCPGMMGSNAHAANVVAGMFAATGQDLGQIVDASACLTQFEVGDNGSLIASVTMPCLEVGTIGGGTRLPAQRACLDLLDLSVDRPTEHLARLIASTVLAGELSLMAALDTDDLVTAHLRLNRASTTVSSSPPGGPSGSQENKVTQVHRGIHVSALPLSPELTDVQHSTM
ncbi:unnamed protein product [Calicophoron daubneyi]|uniref:3-hydroxy-3-methylglutaryl-coenzyme A reductase n=1 Tax=Calicophoron daubneyi TaxID=300641 RepID=A0AAV2T7L0_CALDB